MPVLVVILLVAWLAPIFIAAQVTSNRGRGGVVGLLLGFFLGWIGVIIALLLSDESGGARSGASRTYRECPRCKEQMRRDAQVCPHCHNESSAWTLKEGVWWHESPSGWYVLDERRNEWVKWEGNSLEAAAQNPPGAAETRERKDSRR